MELALLRDNTQAYILMRAVTILKSGGIVVGPSDTVYGVYANAEDMGAVEKVFAMKKRAKEKPMGVFVRDIPTARKIAYIADAKARFLERVWPGAVTVIFHHKEKLSPLVTAGKETLGLRIPHDSFLSALLLQCDFPIVQTSANISGSPSAKNIEEIQTYFSDIKNQPDLIIDAGEGTQNPSAVIDFTGLKPILMRMGLITKTQLDELLNGIV